MSAPKPIIHVIAIPLVLLLLNGCVSTHNHYDSARLEDGMVRNGKLILLVRESHGDVRDKYADMPLSMRAAFLAEDRKDYQPTKRQLVRLEIRLNAETIQFQNIEPIVYPTNGWSRFDRFFCLAATNLIVWYGMGDLRDAKATKQVLGILDAQGDVLSQRGFDDKQYFGFSADHSRIAAVNGKLSNFSTFQIEESGIQQIGKCTDLPPQTAEYSVVTPDTIKPVAVAYGLTTNMSWLDFSSCVTRPMLHSIKRNLGSVRVRLSNGNVQCFAASEHYGSPSLLSVFGLDGKIEHEIRLSEELPSNWYWSDDGKTIVGLEPKDEAETARDFVAKVLIWDIEKGTLRKLTR